MSTGLVELLGDKLLSGGEEVATSDALAGKAAVALYFSAHWCPPCKGFTPKLAEWYTNGLKDKLEIVFVSGDRDADAFKEYFASMPWKALPFDEKNKKLNTKFKVQGIPSVVILDSNGDVITKDGRAAISGDPTGEDFPWKPKSMKDIFAASKFIGKDGPVESSVLDGKVLAVYFSAHWCPPCRGFTPKFADWYTKSLKDKGLEVLFVSSDRDEAAFKEYYGEQPWLAMDFQCRKEKEQLENLFGVSGIPSLAIIDKDGSIITKEGRAAITSDPEGAEFPWYPKPVSDFSSGPGLLEEAAVFIAFCETAEDAEKAAIEEAMTPLAKKYVDEAKAAGEDAPKVAFMIAKSGGIPGQLRKMMGMQEVVTQHEHPLEAKEAGGGWGCDGCGKGGGGAKRFRCTKGCDFDFCEECNEKAKVPVKLLSKFMLLNIPDEGAYYEGPEGDISADAVKAFVDGFLAGTLEKKSLEQ